MATTRQIQTRLNDLGYGTLDVDGVNGPKTEEAVRNFQRDNRLTVDGDPGRNTQAVLFPDAAKTSGLKRIIMHWSAGGHKVSGVDKQHYHFIVSGSGEVVAGDRTPEDNISTSDGRYAAHTYMGNTGSIGVSLASMIGAREAPFSAGSQPITEAQLDAFTTLVASLSKKYGIDITRETVLSHAEVQPTLGIAQKGKWDIAWIPGMDKPGNPVEVGDRIRSMIIEKL